MYAIYSHLLDLSSNKSIEILHMLLAEVGGFEPPYAGVKVPCLHRLATPQESFKTHDLLLSYLLDDSQKLVRLDSNQQQIISYLLQYMSFLIIMNNFFNKKQDLRKL